MKTIVVVKVGLLVLLLAITGAMGLEYGYQTAEPQKTGWPLTDEERAYVLRPEFERRPGREDPAAPKHRPDLWPVLPSAGYWGGTSWLDCHAGLVKVAQASQGPIDVLLVGDSITMQWGAAWTRHFGQYKTVNIGIGGDKTQNVLWRLDHGGVDGLEPRMAVLLIGNNNMFFTPETGIAPAARGIKVCLDWLRDRFPKAPVVVVKIFPAHGPGVPFYEDIKKTNAALDALKLEGDPQVRVLDLWNDMVTADGNLRPGLFAPDSIHLTQDGGYELYANRLKPFITAALSGQPMPRQERTSVPATVTPPVGPVQPKPIGVAPANPVNAEPAQAVQAIYRDGLAAGWLNNPIQAQVNLDDRSAADGGGQAIAVTTEAYGAAQFLRWGTSLDTTLCRSLSFRIHGGADGGQDLRIALMKGLAEGPRLRVTPVPRGGQWSRVTIALEDLGLAKARDLYGVRLWEAGGVASTYYLDDLHLSGEAVDSLDGVVYDDVCRGGWFGNPFAATADTANVAPVHGGERSVAVTLAGGGGCAQFSLANAQFDTTASEALSFWINGGPTGGQKLQLFVKRWHGEAPAWDIPVPPANAWRQHKVPLSALGAARANDIAALWFRDANTGQPQPVFYLDDIRFVRAAPRAAAAVVSYPYAPYNEGKMDPQLTGWPLTEAEQAWVAQGEYTRKPGHEVQKHLPEMWPVVPSAPVWPAPDGHGNLWLDHHATLVERVRAASDSIDIVLIGDSITQGWGGGWDGAALSTAWRERFGAYKTVNLGIGGDRTESVLWRLDHGALDGAEPKVAVLMIGVNNAPLVTANGVPASRVAEGIALCVRNLRARCPKTDIVLTKILPAFAPDGAVHQAIKAINREVDALRLDADSRVHVVDCWTSFTTADGSLRADLYSDGHLHLGPAGYIRLAEQLRPVVDRLLVR
ncbi:MAG: hypothetical protein HZB16_23680 [Armatimonadetes bacterium]|nr:hypothetical protein [Armatimonadota bacterium]